MRAPCPERVRGIPNLGVLARAAILGAMPRPVDPVEDGPVRIARLILLVSLVPALLLTLVTGLSDPRYLQVTAGLGVGLALVWWMASPLAARGWNPNWLLVLASANFFLLTPELALRAAGFRYESGIEFGYPRPSHFIGFEPHPKLFWTLRPGSEGVNSWGFPGREVAIPKPEGTRRIIVLGDSCSQSGYPTELERMLNDGSSVRFLPVEVVILAISGYSSHQGRFLVEQHGRNLEADVALVYFGWNDHWRAWGEPDAEKSVVLPESMIGSLHARLLRASRLVGFAEWMRDGVRGDQRTLSDSVRVRSNRYRENLERIAISLAAAGTQVVFVTAPTSYYRFGVPDQVVEAGLARSNERAVGLHREYNDIVREVAARQGAGLIDLEARMDALSDDELREVFRLDGIHFRPAGHAYVAGVIEAFLQARRLLSRVDAEG